MLKYLVRKRKYVHSKPRLVARISLLSGKVIDRTLPFDFEEKFWNSNKQAFQLPSRSAQKRIYEHYSIKLQEIRLALEILAHQRKLSVDEIDNLLYTTLGVSQKEAPKNGHTVALGFFEFVERHLNDIKGVKSIGTHKSYNATLNRLTEFQQEAGYKLSFDSLNSRFFLLYQQWIYKQKKSPNTFAGNIKNLKAWLNTAHKEGMHYNLDFKAFKVKFIRTQKIYLDQEDLSKLTRHQIAPDTAAEYVRNEFLRSCHTGLRISDNLDHDKLELINNGSMLRTRMKKTKKIIYIPIRSDARHLFTNIEKRRSIAGQTFNRMIKAIAQDAGIDYKISLETAVGNSFEYEKVPKYTQISAHTGRRTFATHAYLNNVPIDFIRDVLGHSEISTTEKYICLSAEERARFISHLPFFQ